VNPGREGNAAFASQVRLMDEESALDEVREISMNQPLTHGRYTLYQSGFDEGGSEKKTSVFSVAYDPGRRLKYFGSLMICSGVAVMFFMRAYFFRRAEPGIQRASTDSSARHVGRLLARPADTMPVSACCEQQVV
jgi:hypothetical protein